MAEKWLKTKCASKPQSLRGSCYFHFHFHCYCYGFSLCLHLLGIFMVAWMGLQHTLNTLKITILRLFLPHINCFFFLPDILSVLCAVKKKPIKMIFIMHLIKMKWNENNYEFVIEAIWILWQFKWHFKSILHIIGMYIDYTIWFFQLHNIVYILNVVSAFLWHDLDGNYR